MKTKTMYIKGMLAKYAMYIAFVILIIVLSVVSPVFLTSTNVINILRQISVIGIMAVGMTFVIATGGIDLSVGAIMALAGVISTSLVKGESTTPLMVSLLAGLLVGIMCGAFSGFFISRLQVPEFIATLATMTITRGFCYVYTNGRPITGFRDDYKIIGTGSVGIIPIPVLIFTVIVLLGVFFLNFTQFGRHVLAVGGNEKAAIVSGINAARVKFTCYIISGITSATAGIVLAARTQTGQPVAGEGFELDAITAVVIGGASLSGGSGNVLGSVVGMLIIGVMTNGLDLLNVSSYYQKVIKGAIILIAVLSDRAKKK
ncbi:ribose transport system permease protein/putative xylitol transport system permease protein [Kineothrix alysoides]|uniref:Ribose transport system permease protein/putative xylitol transport system permease protein n=1 Tax=Kineothrix alysoides TaxID=1469948 RepID=A0A4R1QVL1_9FIRM|nr:hypothetical protein [Kineothrix alysoides]TCL57171.1 ribose transport system permease protein/putative xylitol transport system permease protein [Kineothrix alysoides]